MYQAFRELVLLKQPQLLNSSKFNELQKFCGNFAFGLMPIDNCTYLDVLKELAQTNKTQKSKINLQHYIEEFYNQVSQINPKVDISNSLGSRVLAASLYLDEAVLYLEGIHNTLVVFAPNDIVIKYKGKLAIHTLGFCKAEQKEDNYEFIKLLKQIRKSGQNILSSFGLDEETFPAYAIQGWAIVEKVFKYDPISFAADKDAHGLGDNLAAHQAECGMIGREAWGIRLSNPVYLNTPIHDVVPPSDIDSGDIWVPQDSNQIEAFKIALESEVLIVG